MKPDRVKPRRPDMVAKAIPPDYALGAHVAALAVHIMINTALTGATYDIDGGQQFVPA